MKDARWSITKEFCGYNKQRYVLRFCDNWYNSFDTKKEAITRMKYLISVNFIPTKE